MSGERLTDRAYSGIVEIINGDDLCVGDRLPSESRLAEMFGISAGACRMRISRIRERLAARAGRLFGDEATAKG